MSDTILTTDHGTWIEITLNRPERLNSFTEEMHHALRAAIESARDNGARALLITGAGRGFCAGQDLGDRDPRKMDGPPDLGHTVRTFYAPLVNLIRSLNFPVICAVNGVAAGAGANLALVADVVIAAESAYFLQAFTRIGLIPDAGGTWMLPRQMGLAKAMGAALFAEPISARQASDWGMIWEAVADDGFDAHWRARAAHLAKGPTQTYRAVKEAIRASHGNSLEAQLDLEARLQGACGQSRDFKEGLMAFLEKRPARFEGR